MTFEPSITSFTDLPQAAAERWDERVAVSLDTRKRIASIECQPPELPQVCGWLFSELEYAFATLVVQENPNGWSLRYIFYADQGRGQAHVLVRMPASQTAVPSISARVHAADWHEREVEDLFGLIFEGHPKLGDFILHEEWPEGVNPMRADFDASKPYPHREVDPKWRPTPIVRSPGAFMMPIGPVYSDYAESAQFFLETVGEDVIRTIPRFFYKYRGVEKLAEGKPVEHVLLLAERFSGSSAFAHSMSFCQAVEEICSVDISERAQALRAILAELERFRHHLGAIAGLCSSTALAVAASQASILEEEALRLSGEITGHRYLFGLNVPGGLSLDLTDKQLRRISESVHDALGRLRSLGQMLRFTSTFLDRLEEVGIVSREKALAYGLVGPIARASGIGRDLRRALPYGFYRKPLEFDIPCEDEGDGYARLRVLIGEAEQSARIIEQITRAIPEGKVLSEPLKLVPGSALGRVEAPLGAAFHWVNIGEDGRVARYRLTTPSFTNWHGFHLAAENFAFQDFPIIMASFGLSNAECDR